MSVFEPMVGHRPDAVQAAKNVKRTLAQTFIQIEHALRQVRMAAERHGRGQIEEALGSDAAEVTKLYGELKQVLEKNKPNAQVDDLPD